MNFLFFTILFPLLGFIILIVFQRLLPRYIISLFGVGSIGLSVLTSMFVMFDFLNHIDSGNNNSFFFVQPIFMWMSLIDFSIPVVLRLDGLSLSMLLLVTWVSFFIHIYSSWYMSGNNSSYSIFFAYMNLFVANMIILILADNLLFLYFAWEGVGLCSYLLIGFYYDDIKNGESALKSFVMTRIGDIFLICAIFMLYNSFHTLELHKLILYITTENCNISLNLIALFLCVAAVAKSAQCPFQTWLSDAMVAPTPVSALIHAATMVTAGVYLIIRTCNVFIMAPDILYLVGIIGSITLVISSCSALVQTDIKSILAYSTIGQISYMFIALAVQAWESAIFHLIIHAFFKALLFLASGSLILIASGEQNIFRIAKMYKSAPLVYFSFLVGGCSLSAIPIVTSGFYSKGEILWNVLLSNNYLFVIVGLFGSFLTSLYTFRMIFVIFHTGLNSGCVSKNFHNFSHYFSLLILLILSTCIGALFKIPMFDILPPLSKLNNLDGNYFFYDKFIFEICVSVIVFCGCFLSYIYYLFPYSTLLNRLLTCRFGKLFLGYCFIGWGFNWVYKKIFIKPYVWVSHILCRDPTNSLSYCVVYMVNFVADRLILSANGELRYYITSIVFGITMILLILIFI